jgi:hypothetical protein
MSSRASGTIPSRRRLGGDFRATTQFPSAASSRTGRYSLALAEQSASQACGDEFPEERRSLLDAVLRVDEPAVALLLRDCE